VHFCGVRGSTPAPGADFVRYGGHTACVALAHDDAERPALILDTGTGVRTVTPLLAGEPFVGTILYSHLHWDHFNGLPFFAGADRDDARASVYVPKPVAAGAPGALELLERAMSPPHFPVSPRELRGDWEFDELEPGEYEFEGFEVLVREIPHRGGRTYGYRIGDGRSLLTYMPDHSPTTLGPGEDGWGAYHPAALELASGADALIHDATLLPEELPAQAEYGHSAADYAVALAARAGAGVAVLFHHSPERTDDQLDALGARLGGAIVAAQGSVMTL
jgi:ribonuclease BN (tRNA processing enzyme)